MFATDRKLPSFERGEKRAYVRGMFTAIAPRYDLLNHLLSLNADRRWRRQAVERLGWEASPAGQYLDVCAGTLDLAAALAGRPGFSGRVIGADFSTAMLQRGRSKAERVWPLTADALVLPFRDGLFDGAMVGFGVRNLEDLDAGLAEAARVLRPGARLVVLEFTTPARQPLRGLYGFYFRRVLPAVGHLVSKHRTAYHYLPESVHHFPSPAALAERMTRAGFRAVSYELLFAGICAIHVGTRA